MRNKFQSFTADNEIFSGIVPANPSAHGLCYTRDMTIKRLDHVSVVVDDLAAAIAFFTALGMTLEGEMSVEGPWVDRVNGLESVQVDIVMMRTPDGHGRLELTKFRNPKLVEIEPAIAPPNTLGLRSVMFTVESVDDTVARLRANGAELVGEVAQYEDRYRLCYMRGRAGIIGSTRWSRGRLGQRFIDERRRVWHCFEPPLRNRLAGEFADSVGAIVDPIEGSLDPCQRNAIDFVFIRLDFQIIQTGRVDARVTDARVFPHGLPAVAASLRDTGFDGVAFGLETLPEVA